MVCHTQVSVVDEDGVPRAECASCRDLINYLWRRRLSSKFYRECVLQLMFDLPVNVAHWEKLV